MFSKFIAKELLDELIERGDERAIKIRDAQVALQNDEISLNDYRLIVARTLKDIEDEQ